MNTGMAWSYVRMAHEALRLVRAQATDECPREGGYYLDGDWVSEGRVATACEVVLDITDRPHDGELRTLFDALFCVANQEDDADVLSALAGNRLRALAGGVCATSELFFWTTPEE